MTQKLYVWAFDDEGERMRGSQHGERSFVVNASGWRGSRVYRHLAAIERIPGLPIFTTAARFRLVNVAGGLVVEFANPFYAPLTKPDEAT